MSIISKRNHQGPQVAQVIAEVANIFSDHRGDLFTNDTASSVVGMESLQGSDLANAQTSFESVRTKLEDAGLRSLIVAQMGGTQDEAIIDIAMESAVIAMMGASDATGYHDAYLNGRTGAPTGSVTVDTAVPGVVAGVASMESFTQNNFDKFTASSVVVNALTLAQSSFDELFFPTDIVSAGNSGVAVTLRIPYAYNRTKRANNGAAYSIEKKPLVHALEDSSILESETTLIVPRADAAANNDSFLVDPADVANKVVVINGQDVETRPLVFGKEIDLLAVSAHPAVVGSDQQDETDALDPSMSIGKIYIKVTADVGGTPTPAIFEFNLDGSQGALFTKPAEAGGSDMTVNFTNSVILNNTMRAVDNTSVDALGIHTKLGAVLGDQWSVGLKVELSGKSNTEAANMKIHNNGISIGDAFANDDVVAKTSTEYSDLTSDVTVELIGYVPRARRINANLRTKGVFIDNSESNSYYYPISIGSPIAAVHPVGGNGGGASVDGLVQASRIRSSNAAVSTLLAAEDRIKQMMASGTIQSNATTIGAHFVRPMHIERAIDVKADLAVRRSAEGYEDLRGFIVDELTTIADKLALESGYLSALENFMAGDKEYEVIIGTDPRIAGLLMISGDERTLGGKHKFRIESSLDKRMRGKIFLSFRRTNKSGIDALSFGSHLSMPALVHEVTNSSLGGATVSELQVQPRELHTVTLPLLARLEITSLDEYHKRS